MPTLFRDYTPAPKCAQLIIRFSRLVQIATTELADAERCNPLLREVYSWDDNGAHASDSIASHLTRDGRARSAKVELLIVLAGALHTKECNSDAFWTK